MFSIFTYFFKNTARKKIIPVLELEIHKHWLNLHISAAYTILRNETKRSETKSGEIEQN